MSTSVGIHHYLLTLILFLLTHLQTQCHSRGVVIAFIHDGSATTDYASLTVDAELSQRTGGQKEMNFG